MVSRERSPYSEFAVTLLLVEFVHGGRSARRKREVRLKFVERALQVQDLKVLLGCLGY